MLSLILLTGTLVTVAAAAAPGLPDPGSYLNWTWNHSIEFPRGYWSDGSHWYQFYLYRPDSLWDPPVVTRAQQFLVTPMAPLLKDQVQLRGLGLLSSQGVLHEIHPAQDTVMQLSWLSARPTRQEAKAWSESLVVMFRWDGGDWVVVPAGPVTSYCTRNPGLFWRRWGAHYE